MKKKPLFKRLASWIVTIYARHLYDSTRRRADKQYALHRRMFYVATKQFAHNQLTIYDRRTFKICKSVYGFHARLLTLETLKNGCFYHTPDKAGNQAMTEKEIKFRRDAFIHDRLHAARLL